MFFYFKSFLFFIFGFLFNFLLVFSDDLLDDAYNTSDEYVTDVVSSSKDADGFAGLLSGVADFLLVVSAVLGVTAVLFVGIMFVLSAGDDSKMIKARKMLFYIGGGIIMALSSYAIVQIIQSISVSTL
ncbi:hypothetical protein [Candidatus Vampirococcus lugosii]|uniref:hypothetical protein n=1 Tax=Candidatus Vampirococcus lugosii TaxID=2789015 RepID=UPI001BCB80C0|nr:hypothetical protein [Candidatus Vampirococcus lugosii]